MKRPVFIANWKMHQGPSDARAFMRAFLSQYPRRQDRTVIICPPAVSVTAVSESLKDRSDILVGVQNIHWEDQGAFTGELAAPMARDAGARLALVGHSERRHVFGETEMETGRKCEAAARAGLTPILCVGETIAQREAGETAAVVTGQMRAGLAALDQGQIANVVLAYEPVWAIGTGRTATPEDATEIHSVLRKGLRALAGERAAVVPILYGGSVNRGNAQALIAAPDVDGLLVGGASLDADGWASIVMTRLPDERGDE